MCRQFSKLAAVLALTTWPLLASSDDASVYEMLEDVSIGRVFFSPQERANLDRKRHAGPVVRQKATGGMRAGKKTRGDAAGYIVNNAGKARVYDKGEFVAATLDENPRFPGDVDVVRKAPRDNTDQSKSESSDAPE